jgi:regulation of enolase protein 1 (concanavalin A-like superfamily)
MAPTSIPRVGALVVSLRATLPLLTLTFFLAACDRPGVKDDSTGSSAAAAPHRAELGSWGSLLDPIGDVAVVTNGGSLTMTVPAGIRDLSAVRREGGNAAPRVLQSVEGNFVALIKVTADFNPPKLEDANAFVGAGILVFDSDEHFLRLERDVWTTPEGRQLCYAPLFEYWHQGSMRSEESGAPAAFFQGKSTFLSLERKGYEFIAAISHDGSTWTESNRVLAQLPRKVRVGLCAINTASVPLKVEFSEWKLTKVTR